MPEPALELLQAMVQRVLDGQHRMAGDLADIKRRMTAVEIQLGNLAATEQSHYANVALRLDGYDSRLERIEQRLELSGALAT